MTFDKLPVTVYAVAVLTRQADGKLSLHIRSLPVSGRDPLADAEVIGRATAEILGDYPGDAVVAAVPCRSVVDTAG